MTNAKRNGEIPRSLDTRVQPPYMLPEILVNNIRVVARDRGITPSQLAEEILDKGLRARMFPPDAIVYGQGGIIRKIQKLDNSNPRPNLTDHPV